MKRITVALIVLALTGSWSANAQKFDLSTLTCSSFIQSDKDQMKLITAWLAGYYTDESADEIVDVAALNKLQDALVKFCTRESNFMIANAADGILGHEGATGAAADSSSKTP